MKISDDFKERIKLANPIEEVMGTVATLKRQGKDYVCLCPFHSEKTPSCHIEPDKQLFFCFGCHAGGDVITFVMKYMSLDYPEAVKWLADRSGIELPEEETYSQKGKIPRKKALEINKVAARFFFDNLRSPQGKVCLDYLMKKRGLTVETIKKYGMGFAPNSWNALKNYMLSKGYTESELEQVSLISRSQHNTKKTFDFFVNRAMFPFFDLTGNIVGFGGRDLSDKDSRKYLNSKDGVLYHKNSFLFSMNFAKNAVSKNKTILLCEGNLDVISLNQAGFENAVASCGTALTPQQVRNIANYADKVVICYDADTAGQKATSKAIGMFNEVGITAEVIHMEGAKDPDEYIKKFGAPAFNMLINQSQGGIMYEIHKCKEGLDFDTPEGKSEYSNRAIGVIATLPYPTQRSIYGKELSKECGIDYNSVMEQINDVIRKKEKSRKKKEWERTRTFTDKPRDKINPQANVHPKETKSEQGIIYYISKNPERTEDILKRISPDDFVTDFNRRVFKSLTEKIKEGRDFSVSSFNDEFSPDETGKIMEIMEIFSLIEVDEDIVSDYIKVLLEYKAESKQVDYSSDEDYLKEIERLRKLKK